MAGEGQTLLSELNMDELENPELNENTFFHQEELGLETEIQLR